jgi:hypothetical protein
MLYVLIDLLGKSEEKHRRAFPTHKLDTSDILLAQQEQS